MELPSSLCQSVTLFRVVGGRRFGSSHLAISIACIQGVVIVVVRPVESREFLFQMFEVLDAGSLVVWPRYQQHSEQSLRAVVETFSRLAAGGSSAGLDQAKALAGGSVGVVPEAILTLGNGLYQADGQRSQLFQTRSENRVGPGMGATLCAWQSLRRTLKMVDPARLDAPESADFRGRLLHAKVRCEAGLAMVFYGASLADAADHHPDPDHRQTSARLLGFLEPVFAWWPLQAAWQASLSLGESSAQMPDPATGSHLARELLGQRVWAHQSHGLQLFLQALQRDLEAAVTDDTRQWALSLSETLQHGVKVTQSLGRDLQAGSPHKVLANAERYLHLFGEILAGWMWLRQANAAASGLPGAGPEEEAFLLGKLQAARYFFHRALPEVAQDLVLLQNQDSTCLDMRAQWY